MTIAYRYNCQLLRSMSLFNDETLLRKAEMVHYRRQSLGVLENHSGMLTPLNFRCVLPLAYIVIVATVALELISVALVNVNSSYFRWRYCRCRRSITTKTVERA